MANLAVIAPFGFTFDMPRFLAAYQRVGVRAAQFYRNEQQPPTVGSALEVVRRAHTPFDSIHGVFGYHIDPTSDDAGHREHCLRVYEQEGKLARDLGGPMVVVHPSAWNPERRMMTLGEADEAAVPRWPRLDEFMRQLGDIGERLGVTYLIENQPPNCPIGHDPVRLAQGVLGVGSERVRMCFDTGHAHMVMDVCEAIRACAPAIAYLHVHDNDSTVDDHRMPGHGTIEWAKVGETIRGCRLNATRMLEVFYDEPRVEKMGSNGLGKKLAMACGLDDAPSAATMLP